jgi:hypothetical protein
MGLHMYENLGFFVKDDNIAMTSLRRKPRDP